MKFLYYVLMMSVLLMHLTIAEAGSGERLVIYTVQGRSEAKRLADAFMEQHPYIEIELICSEQADLINRLRGERLSKNFYADLILLEDRLAMEALREKSMLLGHALARLENYDPAVYDPTFMYFGTRVIRNGIVYRNNAAIMPGSIKDLLTPEADGMVMLSSPLYEPAAALMMHSVVQNPELGWEVFYHLAKNGADNSNCSCGVLEAVAREEKMFGMVADNKVVRRRIAKLGLRFVVPAEGASIMTYPVAALATGNNQAGAKAYIDFVLSKHGQDIIVDEGYRPARAGVPFEGTCCEEDTFMPLNVAEAYTNDRECKDRFAAIFRD